MLKLTKLIGWAALAGVLAACDSAPKRDAFDKISAELGGAAAKAASAPPPDAVTNALLPPSSQLATQLPKARTVLDERFTVAFNGVGAQQFFNAIAQGTRYTMLVHPEVSGTITANLKEVTLFEALDAVKELYGYDYKVDGTRIYIRPLTIQTKMFKVNYLTSVRRGTSSLRVTTTSVADVNNNSDGNQNNNSNGSNNSNNNNRNNNNGNNNGNNNNGNGQNESANVVTTTDADFWRELRLSLEAIVGSKDGGRSVVISPQSGVILVRAMPDELRSVAEYLKATQLAVERQVILEAKILEVELSSTAQSGVNWASFASFKTGHDNRISTGFLQPGAGLAPLPYDGSQPPPISGGGLTASTGFNIANAAAAGSMFGFAFQTSNFAALISFLESQGTVHVLSSPRIATLNNQKAVLKIGTDEFFVTGVSTTTTTNATGAGTTSPNVTLQPFFSGVVLDVTPQIDDEGHIILHVHPSVSQVSTVNKGVNLGSAGNLNLPLATSVTSEMDSMVRGRDGQVVALGGLMRQSGTNNRSGLPGASSLPLVGNLFSNKSDQQQKRELVVLIKPTIVDGAASWGNDLMDATRRINEMDPANATKGRR